MGSVQIEQKSYEMPPREGMSIAHFLTVADIERSARYYEKVFGARILSLGDGNAPGYLQLANIWMILNVGGGPTPDSAVKLVVDLAGESPAGANFPVGTVEISGDGAGDQTVGSPEVNVLVGWVKIRSAPTRRASKAAGRSASEPY